MPPGRTTRSTFPPNGSARSPLARLADADLVVIDPSARWQLDEQRLHSEAGYSNWNGWELRGKLVLSLLRGKILLDGDQLRLAPGYGTYLPRRVEQLLHWR
jgi:dihydroorotase-like cyclic amidohydrolase